MNEIYIDIGPYESRVAVVDEGELAEIYIERRGREKIAGNIYKGRVENVLPGMQAAFVNIGLEKNAFLYVKDAVGYGTFHDAGSGEETSISRFLHPGDELLVQVTKEPAGSKGARVTTHITLPGRYVVLMPEVDYVGISRRIEDENERTRLKNIFSSLKPSTMGGIIRTEAEGKDAEDFKEDINFLLKIWEKIKDEGAKCGAPRLIHKDLDLAYRSIRDLFTRETNAVILNDMEAYKRALELVESFSPGQKGCVKYYDGSLNIFQYYDVESKIGKALQRKVWLKSGGYIVIDQTEALTSIDVNTGKYTGYHNLKDTVLEINIEASKEIARQLRLRDIGGIIIIDFIDMGIEKHRNTVLNVLKNELKRDRTKSTVLGMTSLGLVEMTRKKVGRRLSTVMEKQCPLCDGSGRILDEESVLRNIERELYRIVRETDVPALMVEVNEAIASYVRSLEVDYVKELEERYNKKIYFKGLWGMDYSEVNIRLMGDFSGQEAADPFKAGDKVSLSVVKSKYLNLSDRYNTFQGTVSQVIRGENGDVEKVILDINL